MQNNISQGNRFYAVVAKISFLSFIFFSFFGTSLPFRPKVEEVDEISSSNLVNQIVYITLFFTSLFALIPKKKEFFKILYEEKFLTIFIIWCTASIIWSDYSFTSFKRLFQIYCIINVTMVFLLYFNSERDLLQNIKYVLYPYLIISILSVVTIPGALDPNFRTWRALTPHKNVLGQIGVISTILCYMVYQYEKKFNGKILAIFMMTISVLLTVGSYSSTSIIILLIVMGFSFVFLTDKIFKPIGIRFTVSILIVIVLIIMVFAIMIVQPTLVEVITDLFGKDTSFSGRTDLWSYMMLEIAKHPIFGTGYQGFWIIENDSLLALYKIFVWLPNQSHNGYIDIWNELGIVGLVLFSLLVLNYFISLIKLNKKHIWKTFILISLISNWQEATFFRPGQLLSGMFIISYVMLFFELHWQSRYKYRRD